MAVQPRRQRPARGRDRRAQRRGPGGRPRRHGVDRGQQARQHPLSLPLGLRRAQRRLRAGHPAYVNDHPPDEVVPVTAGRDLGWPYCNPDQDENHPAGSLADVPFVADAVTNPGGTHLDCAALPPVEVGLPGPQRPARACRSWRPAPPGPVVGRRGRRGARLVGPPAAPPPGRAVDGLGRREAHPGAGGHPGQAASRTPTAAAGAARSTPCPGPTAPCTSATTPPAPSTA